MGQILSLIFNQQNYRICSQWICWNNDNGLFYSVIDLWASIIITWICFPLVLCKDYRFCSSCFLFCYGCLAYSWYNEKELANLRYFLLLISHSWRHLRHNREKLNKQQESKFIMINVGGKEVSSNHVLLYVKGILNKEQLKHLN